MAEGFHDFAAAEVLTAANTDDYLMRQTVMRFASAAARNSALTGVVVEGMVAYLKDSNTLTAYDGTSWWTTGRATAAAAAFTSIVIQNGTVAHTQTVSEYTVTNGVCDYWFVLDITAAGSAGSVVQISLPVTAAAAGLREVGAGVIFDASTPKVHPGTWALATTSVIAFYSADSTNNNWGATPSIALASSDSIRGHVRYLVLIAA